MFMLVLACSTIKYCDESFNGEEVICRWLFRERVHFYKITSYSWKAYPPFYHDQGERVLYCNLWVNETRGPEGPEALT